MDTTADNEITVILDHFIRVKGHLVIDNLEYVRDNTYPGKFIFNFQALNIHPENVDDVEQSLLNDDQFYASINFINKFLGLEESAENWLAYLRTMLDTGNPQFRVVINPAFIEYNDEPFSPLITEANYFTIKVVNDRAVYVFKKLPKENVGQEQDLE
jgi:hypothetical protein